MNKRLSSHFQYGFWIYVVVAVLSIALWCGLFSVIYEPSANEKVSVFMLSDKMDPKILEDHLDSRIGKLTTQEIKEVNVEATYVKIEDAYTILASRVLSCDILIIPESMLIPDENGNSIIPTNHFSSLPQEIIGNFAFDEKDMFYYGDLPFGIYISGGAKETLVDHLYETEERFVLFLSAYSPNMNNLYGKGESGDGAALDILKYVLGGSYETV